MTTNDTKSIEFEIDQKSVDLENHIWVTAYRKKIPVKQMSTEHIKNCIACLYGKGNLQIPDNYLGGKRKWLRIFKQELINRQ